MLVLTRCSHGQLNFEKHLYETNSPLFINRLVGAGSAAMGAGTDFLDPDFRARLHERLRQHSCLRLCGRCKRGWQDGFDQRKPGDQNVFIAVDPKVNTASQTCRPGNRNFSRLL
jgi:hypothetical protein